MQFFTNAAMAFALISSGLLSATIAAPMQTHMIQPDLNGHALTVVESRQCMASCSGHDDNNKQDVSNVIERQIMNRPASEQGDIENRQTMLAMDADEVEVMESTRQIHGGMMADDEADDTFEQADGRTD